MTNYSLETRKAEIEKITKTILETLEQNRVISVTDGITILDIVKSYMPIYKNLEDEAKRKASAEAISEYSAPVASNCGCDCGNDHSEEEYVEEDIEEDVIDDLLEAMVNKIYKALNLK